MGRGYLHVQSIKDIRVPYIFYVCDVVNELTCLQSDHILTLLALHKNVISDKNKKENYQNLLSQPLLGPNLAWLNPITDKASVYS